MNTTSTITNAINSTSNTIATTNNAINNTINAHETEMKHKTEMHTRLVLSPPGSCPRIRGRTHVIFCA